MVPNSAIVIGDDMRPRAVDHSRHNGKKDLHAIYEKWGVKIFMHRCTIGWSYFDPWYIDWFTQVQELKQQDPDILGLAYHVLWPWNKAPEKEVDWFHARMVIDGVYPDGAVDDLELPNTPAGWATISPANVADQIKRQLPYMAAKIPLRTLVYSGSWWWSGSSHLGSQTPLGIERGYPLIEAEYITHNNEIGKVDFSRAPEDPYYPSPGNGWLKEDVLSWQWTSGLIPIGVSNASQDGQVFLYDMDQIRRVLRLGPQQPTLEQKVDILWDAHPELHPED